MSKLYIRELQFLAPDAMVPQMNAQIDQAPVDFSGGEAQSEAFAAATKWVELYADATCCLAFGVDPTATTDNFPLPAGTPVVYGVVAGQKVSAIALT